tara:strand:- start:156 stop:353 length:198 start_codon:yes stop_codon:yes gene_type:complete
MYTKIVNPKTGYKVSVRGRLGKSILRNYIVVFGAFGAQFGAALQAPQQQPQQQVQWRSPARQQAQ